MKRKTIKTLDRKRETGNPKPKTGNRKRTPLAEGIRKKRPYGFFSRMNDDTLVKYGQKFVTERDINNKRGLAKTDMGLYLVLLKRKLLNKLKFEQYQREWASMSDEQLVDYAQKFIEEKKLKNRSGLQKKDCGLYHVLAKRKLVERLEFKEIFVDWVSESDEDLIEIAKGIMEKNGIKGRTELRESSGALFAALRRRKLLDRIGFKQILRNWASMSDGEIVDHAQKFIEKKKLKNRSGLQKKDCGLYRILAKRNLVGRLEFKKMRKNWAAMSDIELVEHVQSYLDEKGIRRRSRLKEEDGGLYQALRKRRLLEKLEFEQDRREWSSMGDDEIAEYAHEFVKENEIRSKGRLSQEYCWLYCVLWRRKLLNKLRFDEKRQKQRQWKDIEDEKLIEYAKRYMDENGISGRTELLNADHGLYSVLRTRCLLDKVGFEERIRKKRPWKKMKDEEIITFAEKFMTENGISRRGELQKADQGLYSVLRKRKLLNLAFFSIDQSQSERAIEQIIDFARDFR